MSTKYLDYDGLSHFWASIKNLFALKSELNGKKDTQTAVVDPTASGNATSYIDTISQNTQGVITVTKKTIPNMGAASSSAGGSAGLVPAPGSGKQDSFLKGDGTWATPPSSTDTKNTAGATQHPSMSSSQKLYLIGALEQTANPQTYSDSHVYLTSGGMLTLDGDHVVICNASQQISNKEILSSTYNGYTLAAACAKSVDSAISDESTSTNLPTSQAVAQIVERTDEANLITTQSMIDTSIASAMTGTAVFKGVINSNSAISGLSTYSAGWYWLIGTAGTYVGKVCEAGDMVYCVSNKGSSYSASDFTVVQTNLDIATITNSEIDAILAS